MLVILCLISVWSNLYYLGNYRRLDVSFNIREKNSKLDIFYFISKIATIPFLILILLNGYAFISYLNLTLILLVFILGFINKKLSNKIFKLIPPLSIILMIYILYVELF